MIYNTIIYHNYVNNNKILYIYIYIFLFIYIYNPNKLN